VSVPIGLRVGYPRTLGLWVDYLAGRNNFETNKYDCRINFQIANANVLFQGNIYYSYYYYYHYFITITTDAQKKVGVAFRVLSKITKNGWGTHVLRVLSQIVKKQVGDACP
jgi:hypothetical protein